SFPTFNDEVDKRLFKILENSNKLKTIYYQDPNANKEILNTRFGIKDNKIKIIQKTEQFVLPLETSYFNKPGTSIYNLGNVKPNSEHRY
ncbi:MAG: hypothetical protein JNM96_04510, partial [Bacteroidia bacterium]|nr:hypothetical protein [Bacteroidia bacterium]